MKAPFFLWGILFVLTGFSAYLVGVIFSVIRLLLHLGAVARMIDEWTVWYSGIPTTFGLILIALDLSLMLPAKRRGRRRPVPDSSPGSTLTVVLTAYNDEASISSSVKDFLAQPLVDHVIVVSNNSKDRTFELAQEAGATVVNEELPGYGRCVYRCLNEALRRDGTGLILLCEGDMTFRAADIDKFLAYIPHADVVNGTRIVEQLRDYETQLSTFMYYGNFFAGKLLECKHLGRGTLTDVGTTYKLIRRPALERLIPHLNPAINLEFNAHFLDTALANGEVLVECPVTFHPRAGLSKGGNVNNWRAFKVGINMICGVVFGWEKP